MPAPSYRDQVLMKLIDMGCGEKLSPADEGYIADDEDAGVAPVWCAKDIAKARGWDR